MSEFDWVPPSSPPDPPASRRPEPPPTQAPPQDPAVGYPAEPGYPVQPSSGQPYPVQPYAQPGYPVQPYAQPGYPVQPYAQPGYPAQPYAQPGYPAQPYAQPGYPAPPAGYPGYPVAGPTPVIADRAPREAWTARPFPQALRGPTHRWWRPLVALGIVTACAFAFVIAIGVVLAILDTSGAVDMNDDAAFDAWTVGPWGILATNLLLASLIPVAMLAVWAGHRWPPGYVSSVVGRVRWRWLLVAIGVAVAVWVPLNVGLAVLDGEALDPEPRWLLLTVVVLLTTPLQAAGEEYLFRGWLPQAVGSLIPRALPGALVAGVLSTTLFALAHGQQDPWLFADRFAFGLVASWLVWRTGGLEAGIAMHVVNNLVAFGFGVAYGQLEESLLVTEADPLYVLVDVGILVVAGFVLDRLARRRRLTRLVAPGWPARRGGVPPGPGGSAVPPGPGGSAVPPWPPVPLPPVPPGPASGMPATP